MKARVSACPVAMPRTPPVEPDDAMAEATLRLVSTPAGSVTGQIVYSMDLLGGLFPDGPWALSATF